MKLPTNSEEQNAKAKREVPVGEECLDEAKRQTGKN